MTVKFKTWAIFDDPLAQDVAHEAEYKTEHPPNQWWITRVYITISDKPPIKWESFDYASYNTLPAVEQGFIEWNNYCRKPSEYTGYKIVTMCLDMLNGTGSVSKQFCKEYFQPKEKVYINGPKKKPFPTKAAKHYV